MIVKEYYYFTMNLQYYGYQPIGSSCFEIINNERKERN